eukprot:TRINITY_DN2896_c0_g1_i2.p1 TRINITY_DN2896_c0_g1~~TRINITY_DN2896_c0_g1_i2.p1  ORF type:complete len:215 (-),score=39.86 TRINITY_DN2896_c0_g1_i2:297-941(-)
MAGTNPSGANIQVLDFADLVDESYAGQIDNECGGSDGDDFEITNQGSSTDADRFDVIVGALEDIVMNQEFMDKQDAFINANCHIFEDSEENKLEYTPLFQQFGELVETFVHNKLKEAVENFDMDEFYGLLEAHEDEIMGDVFETLLGCASFENFKELMVSAKKGAELDNPMHVSVCKVEVDEQPDGEARPDIQMAVSPLSAKGEQKFFPNSPTA